MKIHLVTGATGFVGKYLVNALLGAGENVCVIIRPLNNISVQTRLDELFYEEKNNWKGELRAVEGDIMAENLGLNDSLLNELKGREIIFWHLAANLSFAQENNAEVQKTNYTGTVNAVLFANKYAQKFMHMSTAYVCGSTAFIKEDELSKGQKFRNYYEKSKYEAEKFVRESCRIPFVIFRPSVIIGDAYRGKAEGCTFGYYRYAFMFYFLKKQTLKALAGKSFSSIFLKLFGTKYDPKNNTLKTPWLVVPYPKNGRVNIVPVDYVIAAMMSVYHKNLSGITLHLTHPNPPAFRFLLDSILYDLGFRKTLLVPVPAWAFSVIINCFYFLFWPFRKYTASVMWYVPYFTKTYNFDRSMAFKFTEDPPEISRELILRINSYAREKILEHIKL